MDYRVCSSTMRSCGSPLEQQIVAWIEPKMIPFFQAYRRGRGVAGKVSSILGAFAPAYLTSTKIVEIEPVAGVREI
jgi:hypothetical protein